MDKYASGNQNQGPSQPSLLPILIRGEQIQNGPFLITVTDGMVAQRERENQKIIQRWQAIEKRRNMDISNEEYFGEFGELKVRRRFIRRVFSILTLQLIFTAFVVATFIFVEKAKEIMLTYRYLWIIALSLFIFTYLSISCCECARREIPCNVIFLITMTASLAYLTAAISVFYSIKSVLFTACATAIVTLVICSIATCTKFDLTKNTGFLLIVSLVAIVGLLAMSIALYITEIESLQIAIAIVGTLLISMYLFFDLQTIMGGRMIEISPDEVVYATTQLYIDIMLLYRYLLLLGGFTE
ncbi:PREDICTED: protein lifeguard 3-like [Ceratosolen solmsi marchali]|uniref:Protein lifeguard 3-like n=1 Tax=Ceratosolen solmsi marchali TaxID=326594 RepID=A0AAJ6YDQ7_9HYME|nr:PREDICTED: protein lifeguard 3-like [Ceratosolen solmsi marchali]